MTPPSASPVQSSTVQSGTGPQAPGQAAPGHSTFDQTTLALDVRTDGPARPDPRPVVQPSSSTLLDVRRIYVEPAAAALPRGQQVLARFPHAERVEVLSHQAVPYDASDVERWVRSKTEDLVLGVKKSLTARPNGRSSDFIAPSRANGCAMACAYCYVPRRKGYGNPITVLANVEQITGYLRRHVARQGRKPAPDQVDPLAWVYDIGENSDCSVDARLSDNVRDLVKLFRELPTASRARGSGN